ncbi:MAG: glutamyl-tRNA reductase, partial [Deltaproteobacteria bacterium]
DELSTHLKRADIVISSTGAPHFILTRADVEAVIQIRRNRPMFFIDMAVPRDIDPDANQIDNVYVYDIDDLNNVIETNLEERQREAARAEEIVAGEVNGFLRWLELQQTTPTIVTLRRKYEEVKNAEVAKALSALGGDDPKTRKVVEALASSILNKVLHAPVTALKKDSGPLSPVELAAVVRELFELPDPAAPGEPADGATKEEGGTIVKG